MGFMNNSISLFGGKGASVTIFIDIKNKLVKYYSFDNAKNTPVIDSAVVTERAFSEEFYEAIGKALLDFNEKFHDIVGSSISIILPDDFVAMDAVSVPVVKNTNKGNLFESSLKNLFTDMKEVKICGNVIAQNKQSVTCSYSFIKADLINKLRAVCLKNKINAKYISFTANATAIAVATHFAKIKSLNTLVLDLKPDSAHFVFMIKGKCVCFYHLPFGYELLDSEKVVAENMLFNHDLAELEVLNARERAKSKKLTVLNDESNILETARSQTGEESIVNTDRIPDTDPDDFDETEEEAKTVEKIKTLPKKVERLLPKFMQRPEPTNDEELKYENFREFVKWSINLLNSNEKITAFGNFDSVYVNIPEKYKFVLDMANKESEENGVKFLPLPIKEQNVLNNLELSGGLLMKSSNVNVF